MDQESNRTKDQQTTQCPAVEEGLHKLPIQGMGSPSSNHPFPVCISVQWLQECYAVEELSTLIEEYPEPYREANVSLLLTRNPQSNSQSNGML